MICFAYAWRILLFSVLPFISSCKPVQPVFNDYINTRAGVVKVSIVSVDLDTGRRAVKAVEKYFTYLDQNWRVGGMGELDRVNKLLPTGQAIAMPPSLLPLIGLSEYFAANSGGTFNPAIGRLLELWGFHSVQVESHPPPSAPAIRNLVQNNPTMQDLHLNGILLRSRNPTVQLDFGGLLNGYGLDLAVARIREFGILNAAVELGGITRVIGNRDGQPWRIPVHSPADGEILAFVELAADEGVATLGGNERSFLYGNKRYHELLDPRTGYPEMQTKVVIVIYENAVTADAAAHALFVAGPKYWAQTARVMGINQALLVDKDNTIHITKDMEQRLKMLDKYQNMRFINLDEPDPK